MMTDQELRAYAKTFPSQGGVEIGPWLEKYASEVPQGSFIVEVGCWLGGGTAHLALGAMKSGAPIVTYDRFFCPGDEEQGKAKRYGINLYHGEDTLPRVMEALKPFDTPITYRKGSWRKFDWKDGPIGLYVDDLTKNEILWAAAMQGFLPSFIPGKTILVLQDYHFDEEAGTAYAAQKRYMAAHAKEFEMIEDRIAGTTATAFRYMG